MKSRLFVILTLLMLFSIFNNTYSQNNVKYSKLKVYLQPGDLVRLSALGIAVDNGEVKKDKYIISEFSERDVEKIANNGFRYDILIEDMSAYYVERNKQSAGANESPKKKGVNAVSCFASNYPTPSYFSLGSMGGFYTYEEILSELDSMRQRFPQLVTVRQQVSALTTIEGRKLWYVKISDNPDIDEPEPEVLYSALTHAREPEGMQQLFFFMYYLLENYGTDPTATYIIDNTELFFVPCVNPDGYKYNQLTDPNGGGMHRKNCRNTGASNKGVDLNRNYGFEWGYDNIGSSIDPEDETYRGTAAFSEPETQIMKEFTESRSFKLCIDYHCYSNVLINPWSYENLSTPDSVLYDLLGHAMTETNGFAFGTPYQTIGYNANGGSVDWFYGEQFTKNKIIAFAPEAGDASDGFWPAVNRIEPIAESFTDMNLLLALFAGKYARIAENNPTFTGGNGYVNFSVQCLGLDTPSAFTVTLIPANSSISGTGAPVTMTGMQSGETRNDSISFTLSAGLVQGNFIKYYFRVDNSYGYYYTDTITKIYGTPVIIFSDAAGNMNNWTSTLWNTTTSSYYSPPRSFTDSPSGDYNNNASASISTTNYINLSNVVYAELSFMGKWEVEPGWDYVQVFASTNGTIWIPLCGKYNHPGNAYQDNGNPVYDGFQYNWVKETINITDYTGQSIKLRFRLRSDDYLEYDGFYFDDIKVSVIYTPSGIQQDEQSGRAELTVKPNPAESHVIFCSGTFSDSQPVTIEFYNSMGTLCKKHKSFPANSEIKVEIKDLQAGFYIARVDNVHNVALIKTGR